VTDYEQEVQNYNSGESKYHDELDKENEVLYDEDVQKSRKELYNFLI
jgi:hypothetical protein